jgi:tRNA (guanine-N7-)-methyltransferase
MPTSPHQTPQPRIRSYVLRQGRITAAQRAALDRLMPQFGLLPNVPLTPQEAFGRRAPLFLEIGFGNGEALLQMAEEQPAHDFLGIEVHAPGVGHVLLELERREIPNVRVLRGDAIEILEHAIPEGRLDGLMLFFPDPWPKKKHHKRRIFDAGFVRLAVSRLRMNGFLHAATDWEDYAEQMLAVAERCRHLENCAMAGGFSPRPAHRPQTRFERRGIALGHPVRDILFRRNEQQALAGHDPSQAPERSTNSPP